MIIFQAEFVGDNLNGTIPFNKSCVYNLGFKVCVSAFSTDSSYHHIGPIIIQANSGKFPEYSQRKFEYDKIETFLEDWKIIKINLFNPHLPKFDINKVKSLLYGSMREHKLNLLL